MINPNVIKSEILSIQNIPDNERRNMKKIDHTRKKNRVAFLRVIHNYLQESPTEEFIRKEIKRLENRLTKLDELYIKLPDKPKDEREFMKEFKKDNNYKQIKDQIKALNYILHG
jgi:hypothetical protein